MMYYPPRNVARVGVVRGSGFPTLQPTQMSTVAPSANDSSGQ